MTERRALFAIRAGRLTTQRIHSILRRKLLFRYPIRISFSPTDWFEYPLKYFAYISSLEVFRNYM